MRLVEYFIPEGDRKSLPPEVSRRLPFLVYMDILFIIYFLGASFMRYRADPSIYGGFLVAVLLSSPLFIVSLALVRRRKYRAASYMGGLAPLLNVIWIGILLPYREINEIYKFAVYLLACVVSCSLVALEKRQVNVYAAISLVLYPLFIVGVAAPGMGGFSAELLSVSIAVFLLVASICLIVTLMSRLNYELVDLARHESSKNVARAEALAGIIEGSRTALDKGKELSSVAEESRSRSNEIRAALEGLGEEAHGLSGNATAAEEANQGLVERTKALKSAVAEENALLEETTASLGRVAVMVREIAGLASAKKELIAAVRSTAEKQGRDLKGLKDNVERVQSSSERVLSASSGISDISERIGLLAMNASIEAAHAGASGKGFSVISQEVRKLSEETKAQTAMIAAALGESELSVRATAAAVANFSKETGMLAEDVKATFDALVAIVEGLAKVSREATELDGRAGHLQKLAKRSEGEVEGSAAGIDVGTANLERIRAFSSQLAQRVVTILEEFSSIEKVIGEAVRTSVESADHLAELDKRLAAVETVTGS